MNTKTTSFEHNYHYAEKAGNSTHGYYVRHNVDVYNVIVINGVQLIAVYQTGCSYKYNDYSCPSDHLQLSDAGGAHPVLLKIDGLTMSDIEDMDEADMAELIETISELGLNISSEEELIKLYEVICENNSDAEQYYNDLELSEDISDYESDDEYCGSTLKLKN